MEGAVPTRLPHGVGKERIWEQLKGLDPETATAEEVAAIIGNTSWTRLDCSECGNDDGAVVQLGDEPDYESRTVFVCRACANAAVAMLDEAQRTLS